MRKLVDGMPNLATKKDIKNLATKNDVGNLATKKDIENLEGVLLKALEASQPSGTTLPAQASPPSSPPYGSTPRASPSTLSGSASPPVRGAPSSNQHVRPVPFSVPPECNTEAFYEPK